MILFTLIDGMRGATSLWILLLPIVFNTPTAVTEKLYLKYSHGGNECKQDGLFTLTSFFPKKFSNTLNEVAVFADRKVQPLIL